MLQRVQLEKDRIVEQNRERLSDYEQRLKKHEQERQRLEIEHSRQQREKDTQLDALRNQQLSLSQSLAQSQEETRWLSSQTKDLQSKL